MKKTISLFLLTVLAFLTACGETAAELPLPDGLFTQIQSAVPMENMVDVSEDFLESNLGITAEDHNGAVYYITAVGASCEEIIILRAKDEKGAAAFYEIFETRLAYIEKSAQNYLTEYLPMIASAALRKDGLTVSLIVSPHVAEIEQVYDSFQ